VENNTVSGFEMGIWAKAVVPPHDIHRNNPTNNRDGIRVGWGSLPARPTSKPSWGPFLTLDIWSQVHDNVIEDGVAGVNASLAHESEVCWDYILLRNYTLAVLYVGHAELFGNWIGNHTEDGVRVRSYVNATLPTVREPWANLTRNRVANNSHGVHLQGTVWNGTTYPAWANVTGNNTIGSFGAIPGNAYGVWVDAATTNLTAFRLWWNDVRSNGEGVHVTGDPPGADFFHAECNWWNSAGGPYDPTPVAFGPPDENQNPSGQPVSDYFWYRELPPISPRKTWLNNTIDAPGTICIVVP